MEPHHIPGQDFQWMNIHTIKTFFPMKYQKEILYSGNKYNQYFSISFQNIAPLQYVVNPQN